ncbi:hypothetical protein FQ377_03010 [Arthrobacter echini]|uniref:Uncharacterized protein n=1 Tax=Arthrobacter echini TaxID=1529066 RepID=A0A5D0XV22_9MICC|nr:hypothetical protein [Arthrobacter echini]TYD00431.1 hypothetical protein FQ377_03010 [Arthrobacter echini]
MQRGRSTTNELKGDDMRLGQSALIVGVAAVLTGVAGCGSASDDVTGPAHTAPAQEPPSGSSIAALTREPTAEDQLPGFVAEIAVGNGIGDLDADSVRKVEEHDGVTYYLGVLNDDRSACVYSITSDNFLGGCSAGPGRVITNTPGADSGLVSVTLVTDGYSTDLLEQKGWTRIHRNILVH